MALADMTEVIPSRQKLIGLKLKSGKAPSDDSPISELKLKKGQRFMMLGSPEEVIEVAGSAADVTDVVDDLQMDEDVFEALQPHKDPEVLVQPAVDPLSAYSTESATSYRFVLHHVS